ncbi:hypothetical protein N2152v2_001087 [Parachlorella kessleri]
MAAALPTSSHHTAVVWFRDDLRLADHEPLHAALSTQPHSLLPVYCLNHRELHPRELTSAQSELGLADGGSSQGALLEALTALDSQLQDSGSRLAVHQGLPEVVLEEVVSLILRGNDAAKPASPEALDPGPALPRPAAEPSGGTLVGGGRSLGLYYYMEASPESQPLEEAVEQAVHGVAAKHGIKCSIHRYWGATLYHPDDLPYHLFSARKGKAAGTGKQSRHSTSNAAATPHQRGGSEDAEHAAQHAQQQASTAGGAVLGEQQGDGLQGLGRVLVAPQRFASLPGVMSDFRRPVQANTPVRRPLPTPTSPLPPLPTSGEHLAALLGPGIPASLESVYAAGGATHALARLESLVGLRVADLPPPGAGPVDPRSASPFTLGEQQGLRRLGYLLGFDTCDGVSSRVPGYPHPMLVYQESRMLAYGIDTSAKLSAFLALGCLSPRTVYYEALRSIDEIEGKGGLASDRPEGKPTVSQQNPQAAGSAVVGVAGPSPAVPAGQQDSPRQSEQQQQQQVSAGDSQGIGALSGATPLSASAQQHQPQQPVGDQGSGGVGAGWREPVRGDGARWLLMHLGIRDFFYYTLLKEGQGLLQLHGLRTRPMTWRADMAAFERWARGQTGLPFVDACMRELAGTGYMSNRGRQNVASFLAKGLHLDWQLGAQLFESLLTCHDFALNMGNWSYNAGTGNDPRDRQFRTVTQGEQYDTQAVLIRTWVPELAHLPTAQAHRPWLLQRPAAEGSSTPDQLEFSRSGRGGSEAAGGQEGSSSAAETTGAADTDSYSVSGETSRAEAAPVYPVPLVDPASQIWDRKSRG